MGASLMEALRKSDALADLKACKLKHRQISSWNNALRLGERTVPKGQNLVS